MGRLADPGADSDAGAASRRASTASRIIAALGRRAHQQPRGTGNLGVECKLPHLPLTLNANLNYTPANTIQQTVQQSSYVSEKVVADLSALWQFNPRTKLRLSASNFDPLNYDTDTQILTNTQLVNTWNLGRTFTLWQARLEIKI
ncbi:MAG: hypothetical protein JOY60_02010 [Burkholderiaceae bacterium]|nr:hypothetical protein [Roseateles sp.]MBV8468626.1 hypothetical protein [Burkholderiaceae bacterium]